MSDNLTQRRPLRAAIYCRISRDPEGLRVGVDRQEEDARALALREGFAVVGDAYIDNDISASTLSRKRRPQYEAVLKAARSGEVDVIVSYSNSRLTRRPMELEDLITLHDRHGTRIVTAVSGEDDLSTADGRMVARIKASVDAAEAERTGERLRRAFLQKARTGAPNQGTRPFGWQADKITLDPKESELIRKAASAVSDGVGLNAVCREWNAAGVTTTRGNAWDHRALRQLLKGPRLAGWRVHRGEIALDAAGQPVRGVWQPLMTDDAWQRLQVALSGRNGRSTGRRGARRYLLSGVARCGVCGRQMYATPTYVKRRLTGHAYQCRRANGADAHTISVAGAATDEAVTAVVVQHLRRSGDLTATSRSVQFTGEGRLDEIPGLIQGLMAAYNRGQLSGAVVFPQVEALEAEQATLRTERQRFVVATVRPSHVSADAFCTADTDRQRAVLEELFDAVVIARAGRGARWDPDRITYVWRQA